jgi:excisionase family DNA binding protein
MPEDFLTVEEAAKRLKVTPYTMRLWLREQKVRGVKISQQWRVPESALTELAQGKAPGATD